MIHRSPIDITGLLQAFPYPRIEQGAISDLAHELIAEIDDQGPLSFRNYMARCLYHPQHGYYSKPLTPTVSKNGDFITSVSVGPVFGHLLAERLKKFWTANHSPPDFHLVELGAHNGNLAQDILQALPIIDPAFAKATHYHICEPLPARRQELREKFSDKVTIHPDPHKLSFRHGALIANELLDALPLPLLLHQGNSWHEAAVTHAQNQLEWTTLSTTDTRLPIGPFPESYLTEGTPDFPALLAPLSKIFEHGLFTFIDYGLDEESLHHPARKAGTLRAFRNHRSNAHPLDLPGLTDLTADVNFTAVEKAAHDLGLQSWPILSQSRYLTHVGRNWLLNSPDPSEIKQFQTLIHPSQFGNRFYTLEFTTPSAQHGFP